MTSSAPSSAPGKFAVAADQQSVSLRCRPAQREQAWDGDDLVKQLRQGGIVLDEAREQRVRAACDPATRHAAADGTVLLVEVTPSTADTPARFEPAPGLSLDAPTPQLVSASQVLATLVPATPGSPGIDLYGAPLAPASATKIEPVIGEGVAVDPDGRTLRATADGSLHLFPHLVAVLPVKVIDGDLDANLSPLEFAGDVIVRGSVKDLVKLAVGKSLFVAGAIEAADVTAGRDVHVGGGIVGRDKGRVVAARNVCAKFAVGATILLGGDLRLETELSQSRVRAGGRVAVPAGTILASHVAAIAGVSCRDLGSTSHVKTTLELGVDERFRADYLEQMPRVESNRKRIAKVRDTVAPLMRNQKHLTREQKEKATELLYDADTLENETQGIIESLIKRYVALCERSRLEVLVAAHLYPGVTIRFPGVETSLRLAQRGPVRVACIPHGMNHVVQAYFQGSEEGHSLEMRTIGCEGYDALRKLMIERKLPLPAAPRKSA
jgi:hypothetical protein